MRTLTMVMRSGIKGASPNEMNYVLIADDYSIVKMTGNELQKDILEKRKYSVINMEVGPKGLKTTNGAMDKYTLIDPVKGKSNVSPVVLNRAEVDGKLIGYTIFSPDGVLREVDVVTALKIHKQTPFCNGKVRHTQSGDIIQSIEGNYPIRTIQASKRPLGDVVVDLVIIGSAIGRDKKAEKFTGVMIRSKNAADIAKVYNEVLKDNQKIVKAIKELDEVGHITPSLATQTSEKAGVYMIIPTDLAFKLIKKLGNKAANGLGMVMISCTDCTQNQDGDAVIMLDNKLEKMNAHRGTDKANAFLKIYAKEVMEKLKAIDIAK